MDEAFLRFPHLGEDIFDLLDDKTLAKCLKVGKTWNHFMNNKGFLCIRIMKKHDMENNKNHTDCQQKWRKLFSKTNYEDLRDFAWTIKSNIPPDGIEIFSWACGYGASKIVEAFIAKSISVNTGQSQTRIVPACWCFSQ